MARPRAPKPWTVLRDDTGQATALVVPVGVGAVECLVEALGQTYGQFSPSNPAVVKAAAPLRFAEWRYCTSDYKEMFGVGEPDEPWWSPDGDGVSSVTVLDLDGLDLWSLGEEAELVDDE